MKTSSGNIEIELFNDKAPISAKNFESYVKSNFYKDTIFHRVIPGFMVQGGGFDVNMQEKANTQAPIKNESSNGLQNKRGTLAMARTNQPDSARAQFFVNLVDNDSWIVLLEMPAMRYLVRSLKVWISSIRLLKYRPETMECIKMCRWYSNEYSWSGGCS